MSGSLAGLYDPETGLLRNRNDPRYAMAEKLMMAKQPDSIPGKGAAMLSGLAGIARAFAAQKLMGDAQDDGRARGEQQRQDAAAFAQQWAAPPAADPGSAPAPAPDSGAAAPAPSGSGSGGVASPIAPPAELLPIYQKAAADNGVPVELLLAKDMRESGFDPSAVGRAGEIGISQILPSTAADPGYHLPPISAADARDPAKAIPWSAAYLARKAQALGVTDWHDPAQLHRGIAAYNGQGPGADAYAEQVLGHVPFYAKAVGGAPAPSAPAAGPAPDGGFADGAPGVAAAPASGLSPASVASAPPPVPNSAPHPVMPGSNVMSTRPPEDTLFPPDAAAIPAVAPALGSPDKGAALAGKLGVDTAPASPKGAAMAGRVDIATVERLQRAAVAAASSDNPLIRAQASVLSAQAQQAAAAYDRSQAAGIREQDRQDTLSFRRDAQSQAAADRVERARQHADDQAWRQQQADLGRLPLGYQWADDKHMSMIPVPGGPQDPAHQKPAAPPTGYRWAPDGTTLTQIPGGPADDKAQARLAGAPPGYQWNADHSGLEQIPGGPAADKDRRRTEGAPAGYQWNADHSGLEKIPGGPADKPERLPNDTVVKGILGNLSSMRQLDSAIATAQAHPEAFGPGQGNGVVSWAESSLPVGMGGSPQASIDARAQVANIGSLKLHERSGAAVTASEFPRLAPFIPMASDNPETVRTKLQGMRNILQESLQDQYDTYGPAAGYKPVAGHARALGLEDTTQSPKGTTSAPSPVPAGDTVPASSPAVPSSASSSSAPAPGSDRRLAAVNAARARLGPGASDAEVLSLAQTLVGR